MWKLQKFTLALLWQNFHESNVLTKEVTKELISQNIFMARVNFSFFHTVCVPYQLSLGSGRLLCNDMTSLAYWLNALFFQPSSIRALTSGSGLSNLTGFPSSPGALGSCGGGTTPSAWCSGSFFHLKEEKKIWKRDIWKWILIIAKSYGENMHLRCCKCVDSAQCGKTRNSLSLKKYFVKSSLL